MGDENMPANILGIGLMILLTFGFMVFMTYLGHI